MKSLFKTVFIIVIFSAITRVIGFLFRIYMSRTIGAESLGQYQVSFSVFMVLLTVVSSGLPFIVSKLTAKYRTTRDKKSEQKMVTASLVIAVVLSIVLCGLVFAFMPVLKLVFADDKCITLLLILLPALVFSSAYSTIRGNIWGQNKYFSLCATELFEQIVRVFLFMILITGTFKMQDGATISAVSMTGACLLSSIMVIILYLAKGGKFKFSKDKALYKDIIKQSAPITGVRITGSLVQPLIALIVPLRLVAAGYTSAQALSLYGVAMGMSIPFLFIPSTIIGSLSTALVPDLSSAVVKNDTEYIKKRVVSAIKFTIFISALFVPLYMGAGETIGIFFFDNALSGILLAQAAWVVLPLGLTNITSSLLNSLGYEVKSMVNYIVGAVILLVSIWFLPKAIGINALIFGFGGLFLTTCVFNLKMLKKILGIKLNISKFLIFTLAFIVPSASITSLVCNLLNNFMPKFFSLAISCTLGCLFFVLLYFVFNLIQFKTITCWIEQKIKHRKVKKLKRKKRKRIAFFVHKS